MRLQARCCWLMLLIFAVPSAQGQTKDCSTEKANRADRAVDTLKTWTSIYKFYQQFSACDDGSIGEGVSDDVAKLLQTKWNSVAELVAITNSDKRFEKFVLRHVDETAFGLDDVQRLREKARVHCPSEAKDFCQALIKRIAQLDL